MKGKDMEKGLRETKAAANPKDRAGRRSEYKPQTLEELQEIAREKNRRRYEKEKAKRGGEPAPRSAPSQEFQSADPFEVSPQRRAYLQSLPPLSAEEKAKRIADIARRAAEGVAPRSPRAGR